MATMDVDEAPNEEVPAGNPQELTRNPTALKGYYFFNPCLFLLYLSYSSVLILHNSKFLYAEFYSYDCLVSGCIKFENISQVKLHSPSLYTFQIVNYINPRIRKYYF